MKTTYIKELKSIEANNPILIEGLPGLGLVGKIAMRYLIKQLNAQKFAYLYSPHFPYFVLVNQKGIFVFYVAHFTLPKIQMGQMILSFLLVIVNHRLLKANMK